MKIEELRINNLVRYKNTIRKVVGVSTRCNLVNLAIGGCEYITVTAEELEPIELTDEMLKVNADLDYIPDWVYDPDAGRFHITIFGGQKIGINGNFSFVHELQNAFYLCGLEEQSNDFRV